MRTIKFRGKRIDTGEWVYGCLTRYSQKMSHITVDLIKGEVFNVFTSTVGQFTGLTDKNGKEIFEGDVVNHASWTCVVVYGERGSSFGLKTKDGLLDITVITPDIANMYLEIIGNIHDNPDLP